MRNSYRKLKQDGKNALSAERVGVSDKKSEQNVAKGDKKVENGVGINVDVGEFGLGKAPSESRPVHKIELTKEQEAAIAEA